MDGANYSDMRKVAAEKQGLDLEAWRKREGLTYLALSLRIGAVSPRQARSWALGLERPSATALDRITHATNGHVTIYAMHQRRLAWEQRNIIPVADTDIPAVETAGGRASSR